MLNPKWKKVPRVLGFIGGSSDRPAPITDKEANNILQRVIDGSDKPQPKVMFESGELVRVIDGPFKDFSGVVEEVDEGDEIAKALGDKKVAILQNHGILTTGPSVDIALWFYMSMERCCQAQLMAEAAGKPISVSHETAVKTREFIANDIAAWASYQPAFDKIVKMQPDLLD